MDGAGLALLDETSLRGIFASLDTNSLGYLVQDDLAIMCEQMQVDPGQVEFLMQLLDRDGDGQITFDDFCAGFGRATKEQLVALSPSPRRRGTTPEPAAGVAGKAREDVVSPLARTPSDNSQGKPADMDHPGDLPQRKGHGRVPSVTLTDSDINEGEEDGREAQRHDSRTLFDPDDADSIPPTMPGSDTATTAAQSPGHPGGEFRLVSGLEADGASDNNTPAGSERPTPDGAVDSDDNNPKPPTNNKDSKPDGVEVEPKFTLNLKRFGRRSRPLSVVVPNQYEDDDEDDMFGSATPDADSPTDLRSPTRGKRQHYLDGFPQDDLREHPRTPTGTHENLRHTVMAKRIGLHSIAEALNEHHQSYSPSGPESRSPLMASTPTTGRKMFRTMSPLTRQTDGQELFETAGPLSPVTELSQEDASAFLEEQVRSVLEECNISPGRAIDKKDFSLVCRQLNMEIAEEQVDELFEQLDKTGEGLISLEGFVEGVSTSFNASPLHDKDHSAGRSWSQRRSPAAGGDLAFTPFNGKTSTNRRSVQQRPGTPMQRSNSTNRVSTPVVPFSYKRELFPVLTQLLEADEAGMVKIDTIYKVWQEQNLDMEDEESNAIKFLSSLEMNTNGTVDVNHLTSRLESALENDELTANATGNRYLALHFIHEEIHALRLQHHQGELETQKARNDLARIQEEHNRLVTEGDDLVELQSKRHELRLKEAEGKFSEKIAAHDRELRTMQDRLSKEESLQRQRLEQALEDMQSEEKMLRAELKEKQEQLDEYEADVAEANSNVHLWKSQCAKLKEDLDAQRVEALQLLQRESDDKAFQEQLEMEIAKRMETERAAQKALQDQYDEMKADRDFLRHQLTISQKKSGKRLSGKHSSSRLKTQDVRVKASPRVGRRTSARTPTTNRRSVNLDQQPTRPGALDFSEPSDQEDTMDADLMSPMDMSLMDELNTDTKTPVDEEKLELIGKCASLEREKLELADSNRRNEEKCEKLAEELDTAASAQAQAEKEANNLQLAMKAIDMQKTQLLAVKEQLSSSLEETEAQLITSRHNCRETEDRVVQLSTEHSTLCEQLQQARDESTLHQQQTAEVREQITVLEGQLSGATAKLQETQTQLEEASTAKETLEVQVVDITTQLDGAVKRRAELEETMKLSDSGLRTELAEYQRTSAEERDTFTSTIERLQERLDEEMEGRQTAQAALKDSTSEREDIQLANEALTQNIDLLATEKADAFKQLDVVRAECESVTTEKAELIQKVQESSNTLEEMSDQVKKLSDEKEQLKEAVVEAKRNERDEGDRRLQEALASARDTWEETFRELTAKYDTAQSQQQDAELRAGEMSSRVTELERRQSVLSEDADNALKQLQQAQDEYETMETQLQESRSQLTAAEEQAELLKATASSQTKEILEEWEQKRADLEQQLRSAEEQSQAVEGELSDARATADRLQESLTVEQAKLEEAVSEIAQHKTVQAESVAAHTLALQQLQEQLDRNRAGADSLQATVVSLRAELTSAQTAAADMQADHAALQATVEQLRASNLASSERLNADLEATVTSLTAELTNAKATAADMQSQHTALQQTAEQLRASNIADIERLNESLSEQCEAVRTATKEECERDAAERLERQSAMHSAELLAATKARADEVEQLKDEMATLQAQLVAQSAKLKLQAKQKDSEALIVDLHSQVKDLETQVTSEKKQRTKIHEELRGAISDNTRLTLEMTQLQSELQEQAERQVHQQQRKAEVDQLERRNRTLSENADRQQHEIAHLREELRGAEHLRQLNNSNEERWLAEKNVLLNIIQQLVDTITVEPASSTTTSSMLRSPRHTAMATTSARKTPPPVASRTVKPRQTTQTTPTGGMWSRPRPNYYNA